MEQQIPLNHEASAGSTNMRITHELPAEVVQCLENARFLHLATCTDNIPHVSLMNYTYLPSTPYSSAPVIVMTTNPASKKMNNLVLNPSVSLLVHDWVSHRPTTSTAARRLSAGTPAPPDSSLAALLFNLNSSAVSSISATINGEARLVAAGSDEERFYRAKHLEANTFDGGGGGGGDLLRRESVVGGGGEDGGRGCFVAGEEVRVIVVAIRDVRIADWKGAVRDWVIAPATAEEAHQGVNGVR
ncbi:hypothetical protein B0T18DRAFT_436839 [Schizothecium vesticola]|uniref:Pyridoxamine 5'-phosphate oxidase N-terminal domain-containing protein n=1 Tax=Schizothecium vesticola TaxID=314040 RepID=A0AA40K821_9PEZI|nr:hypothetical protein B0T18DRAFT_436839 [Schizothecium vesticola]